MQRYRTVHARPQYGRDLLRISRDSSHRGRVVPVGGFMLTPRYDDDPAELAAAVEDLARCCLEVVDEMGWVDGDLLPLSKPSA